MSRTFQHHMLVRQEHLNQYGNLFGGRVLAVIDELAFIACARTYPARNFVTRAVENAQFTAPARLGDMLEFNFAIERVGRTSVRVRVSRMISSARTRAAIQLCISMSDFILSKKALRSAICSAKVSLFAMAFVKHPPKAEAASSFGARGDPASINRGGPGKIPELDLTMMIANAIGLK